MQLSGVPEYQGIDSMAANYLEIQPRTDALSKKPETIHESLEMLADENSFYVRSIWELLIVPTYSLDAA